MCPTWRSDAFEAVTEEYLLEQAITNISGVIKIIVFMYLF
jgi:hypothetical protein